MTPRLLAATIRQVPGIASVRHWQAYGLDRVYITFSVQGAIVEAWFSLRDAEACTRLRENETEAPAQARDVERRAMETVRELVAQYRAGLPARR
jgi:hypothetical protein